MSPSKMNAVAGTTSGVEQKIRQELALSDEVTTIRRNAPAAVLYEDGLKEKKTVISSSGALIAYSGVKTGRSPKDKRIVEEPTSKDDDNMLRSLVNESAKELGYENGLEDVKTIKKSNHLSKCIAWDVLATRFKHTVRTSKDCLLYTSRCV